jgi:hypothetical protein
MIHEILPSDVEFAREMLHASHSDAEILTALASRGIEPARAAQLVEDLRHGRKPNSQAQFALGSSARRPKREPGTATEDAPPAAGSQQPHSRHRRHNRSGVSWWFVLLVVIFLWALWYAWFKAGADPSQDLIDFDKHRIPDAPTKDMPR